MLAGVAAMLIGVFAFIATVPGLAFAGASLTWLVVMGCWLLAFGGAVAVVVGLLFLVPRGEADG